MSDNQSVIQPVINKMQEVKPNLPEDWAEKVATKIGMSPTVVRLYVNGQRGKRDKNKALKILRAMKEVEAEFKEEIREAIQ